MAMFASSFIVADFMIGCAILPSLLILAVSSVFNFCIVHKSMTVYSMFVDLMINIERYIGFGAALLPVQITMSIIGIIILFFLFKKTKLFKFITHENNNE